MVEGAFCFSVFGFRPLAGDTLEFWVNKVFYYVFKYPCPVILLIFGVVFLILLLG